MSESATTKRSRRNDGNSSSRSGMRSTSSNSPEAMTSQEFKRGVNRIISKATKVVKEMMDGNNFDTDGSLDSDEDMPKLVGRTSDDSFCSSDEDEFDAKVRLLNRAPAVDANHVDDLKHNMQKEKKDEEAAAEGEMMDENGNKHDPGNRPIGRICGAPRPPTDLDDHHGKKTKNKKPSCMADAVEFTWEINNYTQINKGAASKNCHTTETQSDETGHQWRLKIYPNGTKADGNLSLFLDTSDLPFGWERTVCFALTLVNHFDSSKSVTKNVHQHVFKSQKNDLCNWGWSSFIEARRVVQEGFLKNGKLIVKAAIMVESTSTKMDPSEVDVYLSYAAESGCVESVMTCLAQGACVNSESEDKFTPLHYACNTTKEYLPVVKLLIQRDANVNILNKYGETALLKAAL